jgi:adenosylcobinamide hydrolase
MIDGIEYEVGPAAVIVRAHAPLAVVSSAIAGEAFGPARAIVNLHVPKNFRPPARDGHEDWGTPLAEFVQRRGLPSPYVGLLTSAWTEHAEVAEDAAHGVAALALVTVGLGNPIATGLRSAPAATPSPSTINAIIVVDAAPVPSAMVNCVITVTEVKTAALLAAGVVCRDGQPATGTSTDAVVVAATGRGSRCRFGGPASELGSVVARATRRAVETGIRQWLARHASHARGTARPEAQAWDGGFQDG